MRHRYEDIFKEVSKELGYPVSVIKLVFNSAWKFAQGKIGDMDLSYDMSEDDYSKICTSFYFPAMGKLNIPYKNIIKWRNRINWLKENNLYDENKKGKADVYGNSDNC